MTAYHLEAALADPVRVSRLVLYRRNLEIWPDDLFRLSNLTSLELDQCQVSFLDDRLLALPIRHLRLPGNRITGLPDWLDQWTTLESLDLSGNRITAWPPGNPPPGLTDLVLAGNRIRKLPPAWLPQLTRLDLRRNPLTNLAWPERLPVLRELLLERSPTAAGTFLQVPCPRLERLSIHRCELSHLGTDLFSRWAELRYLALNGNRISELPEDLLASLAHLIHLDLGGNRLTEFPVDAPSGHPLRELDLSGNRIEGLPDPLGTLSWLTRLFLAGNPLTGIPDTLAGLPRLNELDLRRTRIAGIPTFPWPVLAKLKVDGAPLASEPGILRDLPQRIRITGKKVAPGPTPISRAAFRRTAEREGWPPERRDHLWALAGQPETRISLEDHLDLWKLGAMGYPDRLLASGRQTNRPPTGTLGIFGRSRLPVGVLSRRIGAAGVYLVAPHSVKVVPDHVLLGSPGGDRSILDPGRQYWWTERMLLTTLPPVQPESPAEAGLASRLTDWLRTRLPAYQAIALQAMGEQGIPPELYGEILWILRTNQAPHLRSRLRDLILLYGDGAWAADCLEGHQTGIRTQEELAVHWGLTADALSVWSS